MSQPTERQQTTFDTPIIPIVIILACLALSFLDMLLLSSALERLLDTDQSSASILAFCLALVGSATAFLWGRSLALHGKRKWYAFHEAWVWLALLVIFFVIRVIVMISDVQEYPDEMLMTIGSEMLSATLLMVLYIGTGLVIKAEARKLFDPTLYSEWRAMRSAKNLQNTIAKKYAESERMIIELESFHKYHHSVDKQYAIRRNALDDAERTTMSSVVKRVLEDNPQLDPQVVEDILQTILTERKDRP